MKKKRKHIVIDIDKAKEKHDELITETERHIPSAMIVVFVIGVIYAVLYELNITPETVHEFVMGSGKIIIGIAFVFLGMLMAVNILS